MKRTFRLLLLGLFFYPVLSLTAVGQNNIVINADAGKYQISKYIYGHFAEHLGHCIYGGIWVGPDSDIPNTRGIRNDVVQALKEIHIPVLRWPGGCFADTYHWRDGIGDPAKRPSIINVHWGGVTEDNSFGTHEFMDLCGQLGCDAYITGNLGSGTVQEMSEWVEYLTSNNKSPMTSLRAANGRKDPWKVKFWGLGNESWGCGGNMTPEYYADVMRRFSTFCRNYGDNRLTRIACGPNVDDYHWMETLMKDPRNRWMMQGISLHYYTLMDGWGHKGSATKFGEKEWISTMAAALRMDELIKRHTTIMDRYDPEKRIGLYVDEWGDWFDVEPGTNPGFLYQQNTLRDALVAAINLNIFNNHCDRVKMANIAQMVNVLQAMLLTKGDQMVRTPSYYVFKMYSVHQDATLLPVNLTCEDYSFDGKTIPSLTASASLDNEGVIHLSVTNANAEKDEELTCDIRGKNVSKVTGTILNAASINDYNGFEKGEIVTPKPFDTAKIRNGKLTCTIPAHAVVVLEIR